MARYRRFNMEAYIQDISAFLPNDPVNNDTMEEILGMVGEVPSKTRRMILRSNGIKHRYYAIDPATGNFTHSNAQMTAEAVRLLRPYLFIKSQLIVLANPIVNLTFYFR